MTKEYVFTAPNNPDSLPLIRLTTSGIANTLGFNIDQIDDLKVVINEACLLAIQSQAPLFEIHYTTQKGEILTIKIHHIEVEEVLKKNQLSVQIIDSLTDDAVLHAKSKILEIKMKREADHGEKKAE